MKLKSLEEIDQSMTDLQRRVMLSKKEVNKPFQSMSSEERLEALNILECKKEFDHSNDGAGFYKEVSRAALARRILVLQLWINPELGTCRVCAGEGNLGIPLLPQKDGLLACAHSDCGLVYKVRNQRGK